MATLSLGRVILTEAMDPRHADIIKLVRLFTEGGYEKEAKELRDKAAKVETFEQLDQLHRYTLQMLNFLDS